MCDRSETGLGETGEVAGRQSGGVAAAEAGVVDLSVSGRASGSVAGWAATFAPAKRRSKRKNSLSAVVEGCEAGGLQAPSDTTADSDAEACMSACSNLSNVTTASQEKKYYSEKEFKLFLWQTKGIKGLHIEHFFPDKLLFLNSKKHNINNKADSSKKFLTSKTSEQTFILTFIHGLFELFSFFDCQTLPQHGAFQSGDLKH